MTETRVLSICYFGVYGSIDSICYDIQIFQNEQVLLQ